MIRIRALIRTLIPPTPTAMTTTAALPECRYVPGYKIHGGRTAGVDAALHAMLYMNDVATTNAAAATTTTTSEAITTTPDGTQSPCGTIEGCVHVLFGLWQGLFQVRTDRSHCTG